ncbi:hypothetical protein GSI_15341 [Ganoderma sinense ZZ0214-1]|uniref:Uncharacterized protein n=1 Tax=Ganoderma sinense ZZ0214-1 TaxID=1077348 RepID=A0A2G8RMB0_9APHY|nr:hypothetical protein GSI_15341 [Ganoderma sinense ZZ0214-1]
MSENSWIVRCTVVHAIASRQHASMRAATSLSSSNASPSRTRRAASRSWSASCRSSQQLSNVCRSGNRFESCPASATSAPSSAAPTRENPMERCSSAHARAPTNGGRKRPGWRSGKLRSVSNSTPRLRSSRHWCASSSRPSNVAHGR